MPSWTDIMQAFAAVIGIPLTIFTLYKLVKKDKERQAEILNLSVIASQLINMQVESEKRYKSSKKPHINIKLEYNVDKKSLKLIFTNKNINTSIVRYDLSNEPKDFLNMDFARSAINDFEGTQTFYIELAFNVSRKDFIGLHLEYATEEGYIFIQDVLAWWENGKFVLAPSAIIDKNSVSS